MKHEINIKHYLKIKNIIWENIFFNTYITNEVVGASIWFSKENNNIKMRSIHIIIIRITIFINKVCFYVLLLIFYDALMYDKYNSNDIYHHNDNLYSHLICHLFSHFSFPFSHYCSSFGDEISFWNFLYHHVHNHENINQMLYSLLGMKQNCSCREQIRSQAQASPYHVVRYLLSWPLSIRYMSAWTQEGLPTEESPKLKWVKALKESNQRLMNAYL